MTIEQQADAEFERIVRDDFERRCVALMQAKREAGVSMPSDDGFEVTRESLCWRKPDGAYGVAQIESAWQGYQWAIEFAQRGPVTLIDNRSPELQPDGSVVICGQRTGERFDPATGASL